MTESKPRRGAVFVIEAASPDDLFEDRLEGPALRRVLELSGIDSSVRIAATAKHFAMALELATKFMETKCAEKRLPALHISCHGGNDGIQCGTETIRWGTLGELLRDANKKLMGLMVLSISACHGLNAMRMAEDGKKPSPFFLLVGPTDTISWPEGLVGFSTFYHLAFTQGLNVRESVKGMNEAAKPRKGEFLALTEDELRRFWDVIATLSKPS